MHMKERQRPEQKLLLDGVAWLGNVSSSVFIIFVNKILMSTTGYGFRYGEALGADIAQCAAFARLLRLLDQACEVTTVAVDITGFPFCLQPPHCAPSTTLSALSASG